MTDAADNGKRPTGIYGWDWSDTTHQGKVDTDPQEVVRTLVAALDGSTVVPGKGLHGWKKSLQVFDGDGYRLGAVYFGGNRQDVHVKATSAAAEVARPRVAGLFDARTARVDTRVDTLVPFEELREMCLDLGGRGTQVLFYEGHRLGGHNEDGTRAVVEDTGRTIYVGAPTSQVRVRIYEKWLESRAKGGPEDREGTNRVEVQLRPPSKHKGRVSGWTPAETFCASRLAQRLAQRLGTEVAKPGTLQESKGVPDLERTLAAMGRQYGSGVRRWLEYSGGDVGRVLERLGAFE